MLLSETARVRCASAHSTPQCTPCKPRWRTHIIAVAATMRPQLGPRERFGSSRHIRLLHAFSRRVTQWRAIRNKHVAHLHDCARQTLNSAFPTSGMCWDRTRAHGSQHTEMVCDSQVSQNDHPPPRRDPHLRRFSAMMKRKERTLYYLVPIQKR